LRVTIKRTSLFEGIDNYNSGKTFLRILKITYLNLKITYLNLYQFWLLLPGELIAPANPIQYQSIDAGRKQNQLTRMKHSFCDIKFVTAFTSQITESMKTAIMSICTVSGPQRPHFQRHDWSSVNRKLGQLPLRAMNRQDWFDCFHDRRSFESGATDPPR